VHVKTTLSRFCGHAVRVALFGALVLGATVAPAAAQPANDPNPGALTLTASFDVPSLYYFRGIRQEIDPALTMWPAADLGIALSSGDGSVKSSTINIGIWNSLHTGSSGTGEGSFSEMLHYELDFYAALNLGFGKGFGLGTTYTAYTSPNRSFTTIKELSFKVSKAGRFAPYGILAFELSDEGQADLGENSGTYLELGVGPSWPLGGGKVTLTVPVKFGMSLSDYYENPLTGEDSKFGFFDVGGLITFPLTGVASKYGSWNFHAGADFLAFGDTTEAFNVDDDFDEPSSSAVTWIFGIGLSY
jgi:hypothetical protein